jgi:hypothetical protein
VSFDVVQDDLVMIALRRVAKNCHAACHVGGTANWEDCQLVPCHGNALAIARMEVARHEFIQALRALDRDANV